MQSRGAKRNNVIGNTLLRTSNEFNVPILSQEISQEYRRKDEVNQKLGITTDEVQLGLGKILTKNKDLLISESASSDIKPLEYAQSKSIYQNKFYSESSYESSEYSHSLSKRFHSEEGPVSPRGSSKISRKRPIRRFDS